MARGDEGAPCRLVEDADAAEEEVATNIDDEVEATFVATPILTIWSACDDTSLMGI